jgi:hypothetical protein
MSINLIGEFDWRPNLSVSAEIALMRAGRTQQRDLWMPGTRDFDAVASAEPKDRVVPCPTFGHFVGTILSQGPSSITRMNVFTHGRPGLIAFRGTITQGTLAANVTMLTNGGPGGAQQMISLDRHVLTLMEDPTRTFTLPGRAQSFTISDIRSRFTPNAFIYFYVCNSGSDRSLLQQFANVFRIWALGFRSRIAYCPVWTDRPPAPPSIDRGHVDLRRCGTLNPGTFYHIAPDAARAGGEIITCIPA